jgi:GT2 family glycosyltransferase
MKLRGRKRRVKLGKARVLIVMPTPLTHQIDLRAAQFCTFAVQQGLADWRGIPSRTAEDCRNLALNTELDSKKSPFTHFFFLDADTFPYDKFALHKLLAADKPVIAGVTPTVRIPVKMADGSYSKLRKLWNVVTLDENGNPKPMYRNSNKELDELPSAPFEAHYVGGTTILIKREVIEKMERPYQITDRDDNGKVKLSEDYFFCERIRDAGYRIWIDPSIVCGHNQTFDVGDL